MTKGGRIEPRRLKGFRDYLPEVMAGRMAIVDIIRDEATLAGFQMIGTPALEYAETLLGQGGEETDKQVYRFQDHGDRAVALRFDLTVPFARFVAEHQGELVFPFRKLQIGDVWRGENTQKGRYREFSQCDLDIIGVDHAAADIEILSVLQRILARSGAGAFTQTVGNRLVLSSLIRKFFPALADGDDVRILIAVDKLQKIGPAKVVELLTQVSSVGQAAAEDFLGLITARDSTGQADLARAEAALAGSSGVDDIQRLRQVVEAVAAVSGGSGGGAGSGRVVADLSIARGLGYYTGVVFETTLDDLPGFGSVSSGGRYNDLVSRFSTREFPGVGGSVGLDRLVAGLEELGRLRTTRRAPGTVAIASPEAMAYAAGVVRDLRDAGIAAEVGMGGKLAAQFRHADRIGSPWVITVGVDEMAGDTFSLKTMADGAEVRGLRRSTVVAELRQRCPR